MTDLAYIAVKNFERFQHYKDRNPPWIKLHAAVLDDYEFSRLQDASKMHLMGIWILASKTENRIPADPEWIANRIGATTPVDLEVLVAAGFLERVQVASKTLARRQRNAPLEETETEGEVEREKRQKKTSLTPDEQAVIDHYRLRHPKRLRGDVPEKVQRLIRQALKSYTVLELQQAIDNNAASRFHQEGNHMGLDLILRDTPHIDYYIGLNPATANGHHAPEDEDVYDRVARQFEAEEHHVN